MIESFRNIFAIPDLRKRLAFTFGLLTVYRVGCNIPTPGIDPQALVEFMQQMQKPAMRSRQWISPAFPATRQRLS